jgi:hypothetical protein
MNRPRSPSLRQQGVATIELALILLFFMGLLPVVLLGGRAMLLYTAMQKGAHDAARYMATLPLQQMTNESSANDAALFAAQMVRDALEQTGPVLSRNLIRVDCIYTDGDYPCGTFASKPLQVRVKFATDLTVTFLPGLTSKWLPELVSVPLRANANLRYAN